MASRVFVSAVILAAVSGGVGYFVAKSTQAPSAPSAVSAPAQAPAAAESTTNPKVAQAGNIVILKSDVEELYNNIKLRAGPQVPPLTQVFWPLVDQLVASRLIVQAATDANMESAPDVQHALTTAREQIIQDAFIQSQVKDLDNDATLKPLYDKLVEATKGQEEVRARHILVKDEAKARDLIAQLAKGAKFEDLAKANSEDPGSKDQGGELGFFSKETMVPEFATVAYALAKGEVSKEPVKTQFGYHVIQVEDRRPRPAPSFDDVKPQLLNEAQQHKLRTVIDALRAKADVKTFNVEGVPAKPSEEPVLVPTQAK